MPDEARQVRPGYHDPTYRMAGAAPARSALTLRLVLASFGFVVLGGGAVLLALLDESAWVVTVVALLAAVALVDMLVVRQRKAHGEPG